MKIRRDGFVMEEGVDTLPLMKKSLMQNYVENLSTLILPCFIWCQIVPMALPEKHKLPMYFGTDYKELYHDSKITLPQFPPTLCGTKSGFAPGMKSPASLKVICIEPQAWNWQTVQTCSWTRIYPVWRKRYTVKNIPESEKLTDIWIWIKIFLE